MPRILQLHRDEVGGARAVAGGDAAKRAGEGFRWFCVVDLRQPPFRGPVRRDFIGQNTNAVAALRAPAALANVTARER